MSERYEYWYCHNCKEEVGDYNVTYGEKCAFCGHPVKWIEGEIPDRPTYETPEQYKERTGRDYPDDGPVWCWYSPMNRWDLGTYLSATDLKYLSGVNMPVIIANENGKPPDDWRPE